MARRSKQDGDCPECACCVLGSCCGLAAQTEAAAQIVVDGYAAVTHAQAKRMVAVLLKHVDFAPKGFTKMVRAMNRREA